MVGGCARDGVVVEGWDGVWVGHECVVELRGRVEVEEEDGNGVDTLPTEFESPRRQELVSALIPGISLRPGMVPGTQQALNGYLQIRW